MSIHCATNASSGTQHYSYSGKYTYRPVRRARVFDELDEILKSNSVWNFKTLSSDLAEARSVGIGVSAASRRCAAAGCECARCACVGARPVAARPAVGGGESRASSRLVHLSPLLCLVPLHSRSSTATAPALTLLLCGVRTDLVLAHVPRGFSSRHRGSRGSVCCWCGYRTKLSTCLCWCVLWRRRRPPCAVTVKSCRADVQWWICRRLFLLRRIPNHGVGCFFNLVGEGSSKLSLNCI